MDDCKEKDYLLVVDSSVTEINKERTHEIRVEEELVSVTFKYGEETILPFSHGVKFSGLDGFTVESSDGLPLEMPPVASDNVVAQLDKGECIAKYTELTISALKMRAVKKDGGEIYLDAEEDDRADVIAFVSGENPVETDFEENFGSIDGEENLLDEDDENEGDIPNLDLHEKTVAGDDLSKEGLDETPGADQEENSDTQEPEADVTDPDADSTEENPVETADDEKKFTLDEIEHSTDEALAKAVEYGVDINTVIGTGEDNNVLVSDVEAYITENQLFPVTSE